MSTPPVSPQERPKHGTDGTIDTTVAAPSVTVPAGVLAIPDTTEMVTQTVELHEASGVEISLDPDIDPDKVAIVYMSEMDGNEGLTRNPFVRLPGTNRRPTELVALAPYGEKHRHDIGDWLASIKEQEDVQNQIPFEVAADEPDELARAEQMVGRLLVRIDAGSDEKVVARYAIRTDVPVTDLSEMHELLTSNRLENPDDNWDSSLTNSPILAQVVDRTRYVVTGTQRQRVVSRSTLAMIDAGLQLARLTGMEEAPLSILLAYIYHPDDFTATKLAVDEQTRQSNASSYAVLRTVVNRWTEELDLAIADEFEGIDLMDELAIRRVNLVALTQEYGQVASVQAYQDNIVPVRMPPSGLVKAKVTGVQLLESLVSEDRDNLKAYAVLITSAVETGLSLGLDVSQIIEDLVERKIIANDVAKVHEEEFRELIGKFAQLTSAKAAMAELGVDTSAINEALEAQLIEFIATNANAIRRTQALAVEVGGNLDTLLRIIERTGLSERSLSEIAQIVGRVLSVKQNVLKATFPALVKGIRQSVASELNIDINKPIKGFGDRSGATLYVESQEETNRIVEYVNGLLRSAGFSDTDMPISVREYDGTYSVEIGSGLSLKDTIPRRDWLPEGKPFYTQTRGH